MQSYRQIKLIYHRDCILLGFKQSNGNLYFKAKAQNLDVVTRHFMCSYGFNLTSSTGTVKTLSLPLVNDLYARIRISTTSSGMYIDLTILEEM